MSVLGLDMTIRTIAGLDQERAVEECRKSRDHLVHKLRTAQLPGFRPYALRIATHGQQLDRMGVE